MSEAVASVAGELIVGLKGVVSLYVPSRNPTPRSTCAVEASARSTGITGSPGTPSVPNGPE